jgi:hypothetical protein
MVLFWGSLHKERILAQEQVFLNLVLYRFYFYTDNVLNSSVFKYLV